MAAPAGLAHEWDYRAGMFHQDLGMRIDLTLASAPVARIANRNSTIRQIANPLEAHAGRQARETPGPGLRTAVERVRRVRPKPGSTQ